jgi:hypothetical protein
VIHLLKDHPGRRILRGMRREAAVPADFPAAGAATALLADAEPVMRDRMLSEVRAETDARLQAVQDMRTEYIASGLRDAKAAGELTQERMRALMAESAQRWPAPEYQRNPVAVVLAAEQAGRLIA